MINMESSIYNNIIQINNNVHSEVFQHNNINKKYILFLNIMLLYQRLQSLII